MFLEFLKKHYLYCALFLLSALFLFNSCSYNKKITTSNDIVYKRAKPEYNPGGKMFFLDEGFVKQYQEYIKKRGKFIRKNPNEVWQQYEYGDIDTIENIEDYREVDLNKSGWQYHKYISNDGKVSDRNLHYDEIEESVDDETSSEQEVSSSKQSWKDKIKNFFGKGSITSAEIDNMVVIEDKDKDVIEELEESL
ncbi:hypothetical protein GUI12_02205 [Anaplasmataceae bacterium AB001_6]|nr:hypothetical protein GUI12_02205 [Anaplasmataceae bacterium AB001_6]